jgi:hypothetical protein
MGRLSAISSCVSIAAVALVCADCNTAPGHIELPPLSARPAHGQDAGVAPFSCKDETTHGCEAGKHYSCKRVGEFLQTVVVDCVKQGLLCDAEQACVVCHAGDLRCKACAAGDAACDTNVVQSCDVTHQSWRDAQSCDIAKAEVCSGARCVNACELAKTNRSYVGCEYFGADLDNAAIDDQNNASAQQYAIVVANPQTVPVEVRVERNDAAFGKTPKIAEVARVLVPPGDLEVFKLPRREVDGSSATGINDGTNTAVTSNAYRVVSTHPITAYQFNPLENVNVFSNDASLLLPTSAIGSQYTIVSWPQTIGNSKNPAQDFDHTSSKEDLRAFLTIIGTQAQTHVSVELGSKVVLVVGAGPVPQSVAGGKIELDIGPFDVVNLETQGFNADFTGSLVRATHPVTVFVGSEASDAPIYGTYETRQCCADHLEEQSLPDSVAGNRFIVARMPPRTKALNDAALPGMPINVAEINEPEWIRIVAIEPGVTNVTTSLAPPKNTIALHQREDVILRADKDFVIESDHPIAVLQILPSQGVDGIPRQYPGGDPSIITVPPVEQYRRDYIFLTPDKYAFDFVTIVAHAGATIQLDGAPLPSTCTTLPIDTTLDTTSVATGDWVAHRCPLSFPQVTVGQASMVLPGRQLDGVHTLVSNREMGIVVYGFDRFVSYAYVGGLNLDVLN